MSDFVYDFTKDIHYMGNEEKNANYLGTIKLASALLLWWLTNLCYQGFGSAYD